MNTPICKMLMLCLSLILTSCGERIDSELDAAKVDKIGGDAGYQVSVAESQPGFGQIVIKSGIYGRTPHAITACIGFLTACQSGTARPFVIYASKAVREKSDQSIQQIPQGEITATGAALVFPFPVQFKQGIILNITTYYVPVRVDRGWITTLDPIKTDETIDYKKSYDRSQQLQKLTQLPKGSRDVSGYFISEDWQSSAMQNLNEQLEQLKNLGRNIPNTPPSVPNSPPSVPNTPTPNQDPNKPSSPQQNNTVNEDILNQGQTNYCWGYSAFHMLRQYYFQTDRNGAWAQALGKLNSHDAMAQYMRDNHTNRGNHMMTWIDKFRQINSNLPADGWDWNGSMQSAAQKLQQSPAIPSSYCDGRHCTALIGFSDGQFTVADSSGGYTYKAGLNQIGGHNTVSRSSSTAEVPQNFQIGQGTQNNFTPQNFFTPLFQ